MAGARSARRRERAAQSAQGGRGAQGGTDQEAQAEHRGTDPRTVNGMKISLEVLRTISRISRRGMTRTLMGSSGVSGKSAIRQVPSLQWRRCPHFSNAASRIPRNAQFGIGFREPGAPTGGSRRPPRPPGSRPAPRRPGRRGRPRRGRRCRPRARRTFRAPAP